MIQQLQDSFYGKRQEACKFGRNVDYAKLSESMGGMGIRITSETDIGPAIEKGLQSDRICVIDCILEDTSHVYPMVTGKSLLEYVE
jgi:thiamine pyrophosphate-dependent acetolactate synthase large subunit-like protein